jgi:secondary thiamine-phosphate synthase enzyme
MSEWFVRQFELTRNTRPDTDVHDITDEVRSMLQRSEIWAGICVVCVPGATASITTIEYESGALSDLVDAIDRLAPTDGHYAHNERWGDGNGYSHVRAALLGPSIAVPVVEGELTLGTWQQIVLVDFDNRPRRRRVVVSFTGQRR